MDWYWLNYERNIDELPNVNCNVNIMCQYLSDNSLSSVSFQHFVMFVSFNHWFNITHSVKATEKSLSDVFSLLTAWESVITVVLYLEALQITL